MTHQSLTQLPASRRIQRVEVLSAITEPLSRGYGYRHLWVGYTGSGKSVANVDLVGESTDAHKFTIITDQKNRVTPYAGSEIPSIHALAAVEPDARQHVEAIIRGARMTKNTDDLLDFDAIAHTVWDLSLQDQGVLLAIDELADACEGERTWVRGCNVRPYMKLLYSQGRTNKISISACAQNVQEIPRAAISNSDTLGIFRQDRKELSYYAANRFLDPEELDIVATLADYEFLFLKRGMLSRVCKF